MNKLWLPCAYRFLHVIRPQTQRARKVVSDSPGLVDFAMGLVDFAMGLVDFAMGLVDFAIGPVNSVLDFPEGQMKIFWRIKITEQL